MIPRILEPEVMDTDTEALDYNSMDHSTVNRVFVDDLLLTLDGHNSPSRKLLAAGVRVLDVGTGTALIPIELCGRGRPLQVVGADLAQAMLEVAADNVAAAGLQDSIELQHLDAKQLPFTDGAFDVVMSNSIIHHIPEPAECLEEMVRVTADAGLLFVRDLLRPNDAQELKHLVATYVGDANAHQRQMFSDSLHAALTLDEVRDLAAAQGIPADCVQQTTDRHWTLVWIRNA